MAARETRVIPDDSSWARTLQLVSPRVHTRIDCQAMEEEEMKRGRWLLSGLLCPVRDDDAGGEI